MYLPIRKSASTEVSAAVNTPQVVGIVWTDPGTHNVLYHEDNIELRNGKEVIHQPEMTAIFGQEAVSGTKKSSTMPRRLGCGDGVL